MSPSEEPKTVRSSSVDQWASLATVALQLAESMADVSASGLAMARAARLMGLVEREELFGRRARVAAAIAKEARDIHAAFLIWEHGDPGDGVRTGVTAKLYDLRERARDVLQ